MKALVSWSVPVNLLLGCTLAALGGYLWWHEPQPDGVGFVVEEPVKTLTDAVAGSWVPLRFTVRNTGKAPITVVGMESACGQGGCCLRGKLAEPLVIPPGQSATVACDALIGTAGEFGNEIGLYVADDRRLHEVKIGARGVAKP